MELLDVDFPKVDSTAWRARRDQRLKPVFRDFECKFIPIDRHALFEK